MYSFIIINIIIYIFIIIVFQILNILILLNCLCNLSYKIFLNQLKIKNPSNLYDWVNFKILMPY